MQSFDIDSIIERLGNAIDEAITSDDSKTRDVDWYIDLLHEKVDEI